VPDDNFEQALIDLGYDDVLDNQVLKENIQDVTILNIPSRNIENLTGIEDFTALEELDCGFNKLNNLDVSQNINLKKLICGGGESVLTNLDLSHNQLLEHLDCRNTLVQNINITGLQQLKYLNVWGNQLSELDISTNINLTELRCDSNQITSLDVSNNPLLVVLMCSNNLISELDLSNNPNLYSVICDFNEIENLDISNIPNLQLLLCSYNQLESLNLKNRAEMETFDFESTSNPDLLCIEVDDVDYANSNWTGPNHIDNWSSFSEDCSYMSVSDLDMHQISLYPNPVRDYLYFDENVKEISIYDLSGKLVFTQIELINKINLNFLPKGNYMIKGISESGKKFNKKISKK